MAGSLNKVMLIGNVGADPELRYTPGGQAVCDVRIATNERWTDKQEQKQERTEWHRLVIWGKQAEVIKKYVQKGSSIYVEGRIQTRTWDDKDDGKKRYMTEIIVQNFQFLDNKGKEIEGSGDAPPTDGDDSRSTGSSGTSGSAPRPAADDDIPF